MATKNKKKDRIRWMHKTPDGTLTMWTIAKVPKKGGTSNARKLVIKSADKFWRNNKFDKEELKQVFNSRPNPPDERVMWGDVEGISEFLTTGGSFFETRKAMRAAKKAKEEATTVEANSKGAEKVEQKAPPEPAKPASDVKAEGTQAAPVAAPQAAPAPPALNPPPAPQVPAPAPTIKENGPHNYRAEAIALMGGEGITDGETAMDYLMDDRSHGNDDLVQATMEIAPSLGLTAKFGAQPLVSNEQLVDFIAAVLARTDILATVENPSTTENPRRRGLLLHYMAITPEGGHEPYCGAPVYGVGANTTPDWKYVECKKCLAHKETDFVPNQGAFAARVADTNKATLAPDFIQWVRQVAVANNLTEDEVWAKWQEHERLNYDQSALTSEFLAWNKLKGLDIDGRPVSENPPAGPIYSITDVEVLVGKLKTELKAPLVNAYASTLGGAERVSVLLMIAMDPKDQWENGILENSYYGKYHISRDGTMEHISGPMRLRKTHAKSMQDVVDKFNKLIAAPRQNPPTMDNPLGEFSVSPPDPVALSDVINIFATNTPDAAVTIVKQKYGAEITFQHDIYGYEPVWVHPQAKAQTGHDLSYVFCHMYQSRSDPKILHFVWGRVGNAIHFKIALPAKNPPDAENPAIKRERAGDILMSNGDKLFYNEREDMWAVDHKATKYVRRLGVYGKDNRAGAIKAYEDLYKEKVTENPPEAKNPPSEAGKRPPRPTPAPAAENPRKKKPDLGGKVVLNEDIPDPAPRFHGKSLLRCAECHRKVEPTVFDGKKAIVCKVHGHLNYAFLVDKDKTDVYAARSISEPYDILLYAPFFTSAAKFRAVLENVTMQEGEKYTPEEIDAYVKLYEWVEHGANWDEWSDERIRDISDKVYRRVTPAENPPVEVPVVDSSTSDVDRELVDLEETDSEAKLNPVPADPNACGVCLKPIDLSQKYLEGETSKRKYHMDCDPRTVKENPPNDKSCGVCGEKVDVSEKENPIRKTKYERDMGTSPEHVYRYITFNTMQAFGLPEQDRWFFRNVVLGSTSPYSLGMVPETGMAYAQVTVNEYQAEVIGKWLKKNNIQHAITAKAILVDHFAPPKTMTTAQAEKEIEAAYEGSDYMFPEQAEGEWDWAMELAKKVMKREGEKGMAEGSDDYQDELMFVADDLFEHMRETCDSEFHKTKKAQGYSDEEIESMFEGAMGVEDPPGSYKPEEGEVENPPTEENPKGMELYRGIESNYRTKGSRIVYIGILAQRDPWAFYGKRPKTIEEAKRLIDIYLDMGAPPSTPAPAPTQMSDLVINPPSKENQPKKDEIQDETKKVS